MKPPAALKIDHLEQHPRVSENFAQGDFLNLQRHLFRNIYDNGQTSRWYAVETVNTLFSDAVVLILYSGPENNPLIALRRTIRPATFLRNEMPRLSYKARLWSGVSLELPAGGVETKDLQTGKNGLLLRACAEAWEEAGVRLLPANFVNLGPALFNASAFCPEMLHFFAAAVAPDQAVAAPGDGHLMEEGSWVEFVNLERALAWCRDGIIFDMKTELGLRRFADWFFKINP